MKKFAIIVVVFVLSLFSPLAFAQETKEEERGVVLEEVVVTATRDKREIRKVPANVTVVTREDIQNSNAQTVADALRSQMGLVVRDFLGNGKSASVDLRGFGETASSNTLVLIDGRKVTRRSSALIRHGRLPAKRPGLDLAYFMTLGAQP
jgi:iron complex outermembrane receptor protein